MEQQAGQILIVEDDQRLAELTREYLESNGLQVAIESDGGRAAARIIAEQPALVVLDLMLPGADGLSICRTVRGAYAGPILMLTARTDDMDQVLGLEVGADDYVGKPVRPRVLLARIRALLRRHPGSPVAPLAPLPQPAAHSAQPPGRNCRRMQPAAAPSSAHLIPAALLSVTQNALPISACKRRMYLPIYQKTAWTARPMRCFCNWPSNAVWQRSGTPCLQARPSMARKTAP